MRAALAIWLVLGCAACAEEPQGWQNSMPNFMRYQAEVFPVLLRDCGFHTCHGSSERFFRIWGPGRARMNPATRAFDLTTGPEISTGYQLVLSMIDARHPGRSLLLRKPLALEAGGSTHLGADKFGRNIYRTANDAGYLTIARWVFAVANTPMPTPQMPGAPMPSTPMPGTQ